MGANSEYRKFPQISGKIIGQDDTAPAELANGNAAQLRVAIKRASLDRQHARGFGNAVGEPSGISDILAPRCCASLGGDTGRTMTHQGRRNRPIRPIKAENCRARIIGPARSEMRPVFEGFGNQFSHRAYAGRFRSARASRSYVGSCHVFFSACCVSSFRLCLKHVGTAGEEIH